MGLIINPYAFGGIDSSPHRYWRIKVTATSSAYVGAGEIQMRITSGGADQCTGGTAFADSYYAPEGLTPASAFDDDNDTSWASNGTGTAGYIGYDLGAGNEKNIIEVLWRNRPLDGEQHPDAVTIDFSDTSSTGPWTTKWSFGGPFSGSSGGVTTITAP